MDDPITRAEHAEFEKRMEDETGDRTAGSTISKIA